MDKKRLTQKELIEYISGNMDEKRLTKKELIEYVSGKRIMDSNNEFSIISFYSREICYDFTYSEVMELYERFDRGELTKAQMSWHILLLYTLAVRDLEKDENRLSTPKRKLIEMFESYDRYYYIDEPLPLDVIEKIRRLFKEEVAVC